MTLETLDEGLTDESLPIVGVGASAGGLEALGRLLAGLPASLGLACVVVQHLDPDHPSALTELLARQCLLPVSEATEGVALQAGHVYVMPPDTTIDLAVGKRLRLRPRLEAQQPLRPIDQFLCSLADAVGSSSIGVILSGTGSDGAAGIASIREAGGITFAQDGSAAHGGMPEAAVATGCVDYVLPPEGMAQELIRLCSHPFLKAHLAQHGEAPSGVEAGAQRGYDAVVRRLSRSTGVDFSNYKQATLRRRIDRRVVILRLDGLEAYQRLLDQDPGEIEVLYREALIHVTRFFRDEEAFQALKADVFPSLVRDRAREEAIRVWVPGCASGEEVYSIAMCLLEFFEDAGCRFQVKLFGTDVSDTAIEAARSGRFPLRIEDEVGAERLARFFVRGADGFTIVKEVRDLCVFARQDATRDPPFSHLDLISCRNVMIYLGPVLQRRVFPLFHYSLREGGFLLLGSSETVGSMTDLFEVVDRRRRIHRRKAVASRLPLGGFAQPALASSHHHVPLAAPAGREFEVRREADRILLARCAPVGVLIDDNLEILQFRGDTGPVLTPPSGAPSHNLRDLAARGLFPDLGEAIDECKARNAVARRDGVRVSTLSGPLELNLEVLPIRAPLSEQRCFLVLFRRDEPLASPALTRPPDGLGLDLADSQDRLAQLEWELTSAKEALRAVREEREASDEELRAANEELLSSNEELQSTNEELQTAHEELQATNEELITVNEELQHRTDEATQLTDDLSNLISSVEIPMLMLGRDLRIRRFTPAAGKILHLIVADRDRPISDLQPKIDVPDFEQLMTSVLATAEIVQRDVQGHDGHWYSLCVRPYWGGGQGIDGVVVVLQDVDDRKRHAETLESLGAFFESVVMAVRDPLLVLDHELMVRTANDASRELFGEIPDDALVAAEGAGRDDAWTIEGLHGRLVALREGGEGFAGFETRAWIPGRGERALLVSGRTLRSYSGEPAQLLLCLEDVTARRAKESDQLLMAGRVEAAQRLESLGVLAGGIAHDFNNILTVIVGYAEVLRQALPSDTVCQEQLGFIEAAAARAVELCQKMLAYAGRGGLAAKAVDLNVLVREARPLLEAAAGKTTRLEVQLADELPPALIDGAQFTQVIMNLLINASEALGGRVGVVRISTGSVAGPDPERFEGARVVPDVQGDEFVFLEVSDDGPGMDAATQVRAFEPFFTSKDTGRGLGLSAVLGVLKAHGGGLTVHSEPGQGCTMAAYFPVVRQPVVEAAPRIRPGSALRGSETLLLADDEPAVRNLLRAGLEAVGYRVILAEHGQAAVQAFKARRAEIDLVILDLTMPVMGGAAALRLLREIDPGVRVILISGFDEEQSLASLPGLHVSGFLGKPFRVDELAAAVRAALHVG